MKEDYICVNCGENIEAETDKISCLSCKKFGFFKSRKQIIIDEKLEILCGRLSG